MLQVNELRASYGRRTVLQDLTLSVGCGEVLALIGPNGAGKSTLLKVVAGLLPISAGTIRLGDTFLNPLEPHARIAAGLGFFMQGGKVFPSLTVSENLAVAAYKQPHRQAGDGADTILTIFPVLRPLLGKHAGLLSGGERQALALGMVLMNRPRMLLLDEPAAGLAPSLAHAVISTIRSLAAEWRMAVLLVEQNVREALSSSHRAVAMTWGRVTAKSDSPEEWLSGRRLEAIMMGGNLSTEQV